MTKAKAGARVLYWFRTDLRITDSPALNAALAIDHTAAFYPVWCWDPNYVYGHRVGLNRWSFLLESMTDLSDQLTKLNKKQKLHVVRGAPEKVLPMMWKSWGITHIVWEKDSNAYAKIRDERIKALAKGTGVEVLEVHGRHLFDPTEVVKANHNKPTMTLHQWQSATSKMGGVDEPLPTPTSLPDPGDVKLGDELDKLSGSKGDFAVPTIAEMGFGQPTTSIRGGTTAGHEKLSNFLSHPDDVATFSKPRTAPTSLEPSTTLLSPYIKFGCVGVREIWWGCKKAIKRWDGKGGQETKEPENMFGQLEFRDMYAAAEAAEPDFERIRGNSVCRYIDWGLQNQYDKDGQEILPRPRGGDEDEERLAAWREGRTGFPWIDACMRQLKNEGWIHHLARHSVACFITRGQCYISWERGMEVFDEWLIDWDPASNPGNWMWLSCSAFFSQYYRVYGLVSWPQKTDKSGALVRKYCPELKNFSDKYIYAPHLAPESVQKEAKCIIGKDYPFPILDEHAEKDRCIARLKNAFALGLHGDAPEVLDGSAPELLRKKHEETGALDVKTAKEMKDEKAMKKREAAGDSTLDGYVKKAKR